jgi:hypothetical protein
MGVSKIDFTFENLHFSCKGDNAWVEKQLNNVLSRIPTLLAAHKKGENENVVEDVIEVNAEYEKVEGTAETTAPVETKKSPKIPKVRKAKVAKVKIPKVPKIKVAKVPKVKVVRQKIAKVPKIKVAKIPKIAKEPKASRVEATVGAEVTKIDQPAKLGRNPKVADKIVAKVSGAKKKIASIKSIAAQTDSPLSQFIADKKVSTNQVRKFLATAVFLANSSGVSRLSTSMISKALKSDGIEKLQNASDCLNKNEKKGYCIKDGKEFIITENGYLSIG